MHHADWTFKSRDSFSCTLRTAAAGIGHAIKQSRRASVPNCNTSTTFTHPGGGEGRLAEREHMEETALPL